MFNPFSDYEKKVVVYISSSVPHSIADFYKCIDELTNIGIHTRYINRDRRFLITENVIVYFKAEGQSLVGTSGFDEMFGCVSNYDLYRLKDRNKPRYSGSLVEYIKKIEENAKTDKFLNEELEKLRAEK